MTLFNEFKDGRQKIAANSMDGNIHIGVLTKYVSVKTFKEGEAIEVGGMKGTAGAGGFSEIQFDDPQYEWFEDVSAAAPTAAAAPTRHSSSSAHLSPNQYYKLSYGATLYPGPTKTDLTQSLSVALPSGTVFQCIEPSSGATGDWYRVQYWDQTGAPHFGHLETANLAVTPYVPPAAQPAPSAAAPNRVIIYTAPGDTANYHTVSCRMLGMNRTAIPISAAKERGLVACSSCRPP